MQSTPETEFKNLYDLVQVLTTAKNAMSENVRMKKEIESKRIDCNQYKKQIQDLNKEVFKLKLLANTSTFVICHQCDGLGGFSIDMGEQGGHSEMCDNCNGTGLENKK